MLPLLAGSSCVKSSPGWVSCGYCLKMPCAQEVAEDAEALILKHFTDWDSVPWLG